MEEHYGEDGINLIAILLSLEGAKIVVA